MRIIMRRRDKMPCLNLRGEMAKRKVSIEDPKLNIAGILLTMCEKRTTLCKLLTEEVTENFQEQIHIFDAQIPSTIKVGESIYYGKPLGMYSPMTKSDIHKKRVCNRKSRGAYVNGSKELYDEVIDTLM